MIDFLLSAATEIAVVFYEGSLYILVGFVIAGLLAELVPSSLVSRHLGGNDLRSVTMAALFGAPIPLCSCGVLPAAAGLRRQGASKPATMSFLISTPETGVDSIALTYALLGPVMAVIRPLVAVLTAIFAGVMATTVDEDDGDDTIVDEVAALERHRHPAGGDPCSDACETPQAGGRVGRVLRYGFVTLLDELAFWMVIGIGLTGILSAALPDDFFTRVVAWDRGLVPMLAMMAVGVPLYLCASASTPVAAALLAKGLSPGAALVFLLTGPATNAATIAVVGQLLGRRRLKLYLASIAFVSLGAGLLLDAYGGAAVRATVLAADGPPDSAAFAAVKTAAAVVFALALAASLARTGFRSGLGDLREQTRDLARGMRALSWRDLASGPGLAAAALLLGFAIAPSVTLTVAPGQQGIVRTFGIAHREPLPPGLHFHLPPPLGSGEAVDVDLVREVTLGFRGPASGRRAGIDEQAFYLTADENVLDVRSVVRYRVADPFAYALRSSGVDETLRALGRAALVELLAGRAIDALYTTDRRGIEEEAARALALAGERLGLGIAIVDVRLLDVHAPSDVHEAFRDIASALEDRAREIRDADGYAAEQAAIASGTSEALRQEAAASAAATVGKAEGNAAAFAGIAAAHARAPFVTELRLYLETMERTLAGPTKYVNGASAEIGDIDLWLGLGRAEAVPEPPAEEEPEIP